MNEADPKIWDALKYLVKAGLVVFAVWVLGVLMLWW